MLPTVPYHTTPHVLGSCMPNANASVGGRAKRWTNKTRTNSTSVQRRLTRRQYTHKNRNQERKQPKMNTPIESWVPCSDTLSTTESETSAAVVSLYQSWTGVELGNPESSRSSVGSADAEVNQDLNIDIFDCNIPKSHIVPPLIMEIKAPNGVSFNPAKRLFEADDDITLSELEEDESYRGCLREALKKRLRSEEDIPQIPKLRRRDKPLCLFLNYMGKRHVETPVTPTIVAAEDPVLWHVGLGLAEHDVLFPLSVNGGDTDCASPH